MTLNVHHFHVVTKYPLIEIFVTTVIFFTIQARHDHFRTDSPTEPPSLSPTSPAEKEKRPVTFLLWCHKFIDSGIWLLSGAPGKFGWMLRLLDPLRIVKLQNWKTKCHSKELGLSKPTILSIHWKINLTTEETKIPAQETEVSGLILNRNQVI